MEEVSYTENDVDAAMCAWQHVLKQLRSARERNPWRDFREAYGEDVLRATIARESRDLETAWREAKANKYAKDFALDFVPQYLEMHITKILT